LPYAHRVPYVKSLEEAIENFKPTVLIGVSGQASQFTKEVIQKMSSINNRPIIFALSNPTSKSECTAYEAYKWSEGQAIFASGSPFDPVDYEGKTYVPGQGNNVYIFPGVGLGLIYSKSQLVTDKMFLEAAKVLTSFVTDEDLSNGTVYPSFDNIRDISAAIATAVTNIAIEDGLSEKNKKPSMEEHIKEKMYQPDYPTLL
jgi:malate dehydrogenase (oxaloacetate-decarboxylating)(NADP+)